MIWTSGMIALLILLVVLGGVIGWQTNNGWQAMRNRRRTRQIRRQVEQQLSGAMHAYAETQLVPRSLMYLDTPKRVQGAGG